MEKRLCDQCGSQMKFKERIKSNKKYRIRRFECPCCGHLETVFAGGFNDDVIEPSYALDAVNKMYKQEKSARE